MWLLIDDCREAGADVIARTADAGKKMLASGLFDAVIFDHDLGEAVSGYDILVWAIESHNLPPRVELITSNPVGRDRMKAALIDTGYITKNGLQFYRKNILQ